MGRNGPPRPPAIADFQPDAVHKAVMSQALTSPLTLFPVVGGVLAAAVGLLFGLPWCVMAAGGGILVGGGNLLFKATALKEGVRRDYFRKLQQRRERYKQFTIQQVKTGLEEAFQTEAARRLAEKGVAQFDHIRRTLESVQGVLTMKLAIDELTFQRYSGAAENAYLSVLDNLKDVVAVLRSLDSIDVDGVQARLQQLETSSDTRATEEKSALEERLALLRSQTERAQLRLSKNEVVMTKMEQISARAAEWQTDVQFAATDVEAAITELVRLADFAHELT